jgi:hypothetical protein
MVRIGAASDGPGISTGDCIAPILLKKSVEGGSRL